MLARLYCFAVVEHATRRVHVLGGHGEPHRAQSGCGRVT
jgi:hypothetical protein